MPSPPSPYQRLQQHISALAAMRTESTDNALVHNIRILRSITLADWNRLRQIGFVWEGTEKPWTRHVNEAITKTLNSVSDIFLILFFPKGLR